MRKRILGGFAIPLLGLSLLLLPTISHAEEKGSPSEISSTSSTSEIVEVFSSEEAAKIPKIPEENNKIIPFISDPSGWQSRNTYPDSYYKNWVYPGTSAKRAIPDASGVNWISAGGNFKIEFSDLFAGNSFSVQVMEYDPSNPDDPIGDTVRINDFDTVTVSNISETTTDGDNDEAEFYVLIFNSLGDDYVYAEGFD